MASYGQFCPVAKTMEILGERWTILVIRELLAGSHHFNELRRGVPKMSPALLSKRLRSLTHAGLILRINSGSKVRYELTPAGRELAPVVMELGNWGVRWVPQLSDEDLDPRLLMWDMHRNVDVAAVPDGRTVIGFRFSDVERGSDRWWLVINSREAVDICDVDPGFEVLVTATTALRTMVRIWRGDTSWDAALRGRTLVLEGSEQARRSVPVWLKLSTFAAVPRPSAAPTGVRETTGVHRAPARA